jgi:hypothetical protein
VRLGAIACVAGATLAVAVGLVTAVAAGVGAVGPVRLQAASSQPAAQAALISARQRERPSIALFVIEAAGLLDLDADLG